MTSPYELVRDRFNFPFPLYPFQVEEVNRLSEGNVGVFQYSGTTGAQGDGVHAGHYDEPGTGKTSISTHQMLYQMEVHGVKHFIILVPPILIPQWAGWLRTITDKRTGKPLEVSEYVGGPQARRKVNLNAKFIIMSYTIFKNDFGYIGTYYDNKYVGLVADEGHALKNTQSQNHKAFYQFVGLDRPRQILTGTPLTKSMDAYAYCRLISPGRYRNLRHFEQLHVAERDNYDKPIAFMNLDILAESMRINSSRILRREARQHLPPVTYTPIKYDLAPAHLKLYEQLATEKLLEFEDGREVNAINESALYSALQQIVLNWGEFADTDDPRQLRPAALDVVDMVMEEIGEDRKLVIVAHFIRSNRFLLDRLRQYGTTAIYGEVSARGKAEAIDRFKHDPECRIIQLQPSSAGFGIDGLQHVSSDMLFLEAPTVAPPFLQTVARLDRDGQEEPVNCRIAIAKGTVQQRMFSNLLKNDREINQVQRGYRDLREAVLGPNAK